MQYLLVGEAPGPNGDWRHLEIKLACKAAGWRQALGPRPLWMNREHPKLATFCRATTHVNLLEEYPGDDGHGSFFPPEEGRARAEALRTQLKGNLPFYTFSGVHFPRPDVILLAGRRVSMAFGFGDASPFETLPRLPWPWMPPAAVVPHPSGVNRWWNEPSNRNVALAFLNALGSMVALYAK